MKELKKDSIFATAIGEMAEWSNAAVLKTVEGHTSGGSNPSFSAKRSQVFLHLVFLLEETEVYFKFMEIEKPIIF